MTVLPGTVAIIGTGQGVGLGPGPSGESGKGEMW
ncbi:hypothetical protein GGD81_004148 [Rhodobium orientis]|nr:hypothetical protein [Rhodobium orientis]